MHDTGAGADRHQTRQGTIMDEAGVVFADDDGGQNAADHGQQGVHGDETGDTFQRLR